jgi:RNA polymerase sigma-70 factor (ECF subfamily)
MDVSQLIEGPRRGDVEDFRRFVDAASGTAMALAINILGNRDDAEDACQEAFIQVYSNLESYDPGRSFKAWFTTILYRRCLDQLKRRRRSSALLTKARSDPSLLPAGDPPPGFNGRDIPDRLLDRLNAKERTSVCLWANEGYTSAEIAEVLGCAPVTARVHLYQARKKIKALLEKDHVSLPNR